MNRDLLRQVWVSASAVLCVYGTLLGFGVIGTPVEESAGGALSADATLLAPGGPAFSIWSVIYLGLAAYTVWQWLPVNKESERARASGWLAGLSMLLNAAWITVTQWGWVWVSVVVIVVLALTLGLIVRALTVLPAPGLADRIVVDGTFGLYLGWVTVATCANVAAAGSTAGFPAPRILPVVAMVVLAAAAGLGVLFALRFGGRLAVAVAAAWGLAWIAVARLTGQPESTAVGAVAVVAAVIVVGAALVVRGRMSGARAAEA